MELFHVYRKGYQILKHSTLDIKTKWDEMRDNHIWQGIDNNMDVSVKVYKFPELESLVGKA